MGGMGTPYSCNNLKHFKMKMVPNQLLLYAMNLRKRMNFKNCIFNPQFPEVGYVLTSEDVFTKRCFVYCPFVSYSNNE